MAGGDDLVPREELENSQATLAALQRIFDDFQTSSRETEEELEEQLSRVSEVDDLCRRCSGDSDVLYRRQSMSL